MTILLKLIVKKSIMLFSYMGKIKGFQVNRVSAFEIHWVQCASKIRVKV